MLSGGGAYKGVVRCYASMNADVLGVYISWLLAAFASGSAFRSTCL